MLRGVDSQLAVVGHRLLPCHRVIGSSSPPPWPVCQRLERPWRCQLQILDSLTRLRAAWPLAAAAAIETYCSSSSFGKTYDGHKNDAGYLLAGLEAYAEHWNSLHSHKGTCRQILDRAAADEIRYHWMNGRRFDRPVAALSRCIYNMVHERPNKVLHRQTLRSKQNANAIPNYSGMPSSH